MTTTTLTLAAFLEARLAEDEAAARACLEMFPTPWEISDRGWRVRIYASEVPTEDFTSDDEEAMTARHPVVMEVEPDHRIVDPLWLSDRVDHIARHDPARVLAEVASKRAILECHKSWPVLIEGPPTFEPVDGGIDSLAFRASRQIQWLTEQEYRARFGDEPRTAPMLRHLAAVYSDHPDYDPSWAVS